MAARRQVLQAALASAALATATGATLGGDRPAQLLRTSDGAGLVISARAQRAQAQALAGDLRLAAARLEQVWGGDWPRPLTAWLPASQAQASQWAGVSLAGLAALTIGYGGATDKLVLNPEVLATLPPASRTMVLTHEATHLVTRAHGLPRVPLWLAEGYADTVAYQVVPTPEPVILRDLATAARAGQVPPRLPTPADFAAGSPSAAWAYPAAWLAVQELIRAGGLSAVTRLYRLGGPDGQAAATDLDDEASLDAAMKSSVGLGVLELRAAWVQRLREVRAG